MMCYCSHGDFGCRCCCWVPFAIVVGWGGSCFEVGALQLSRRIRLPVLLLCCHAPVAVREGDGSCFVAFAN